MSSQFGNSLKISIFGQSHSAAIGVLADGFPVGFEPDMARLAEFMRRRAPGGRLSTKRKEADEIEVLSGISGGCFNGAPFCAVIKNTDTRSADYSETEDKPRPGHADYTAWVKYSGYQDKTGGGHFSGRLTAPLCAAGGIALQILEKQGVFIGSHIKSVAGISDDIFDKANISEAMLYRLAKSDFPTIDEEKGKAMQSAIEKAAAEGDSVGGSIECAAIGLTAGLGDPMFDGMESILAKTLFGIPAVKAVEFGNGFDACSLKGSENNDEFYINGGRIMTKTNNCGGILGGITTGMPLVFTVGIKPTPSIFKQQNTVSLHEKKDTALSLRGRHDPCIVKRAVPVIESVCALCVLDAMLTFGKQIINL